MTINPVFGYSNLVPLEKQLESIRKCKAQRKESRAIESHSKQSTTTRESEVHPDGHPPAKRRLTLSQYRSRRKEQASTVLTCLLLLLLVKLGRCAFNISYPQPGLYIEQVGEAKIRRGTLRVEVNVPLNMTADLIRLNKTISQMTEICDKSQHHSNEVHCNVLLHHLKEKERCIIRDINILSTSKNRRSKRGILGNILQTVFGVNDEVYTDISAIKENQRTLIQATQHQTSLMLSTIAQVKDTETRTEQKINAVSVKLNNIISELNKVEGWFTSIDMNRVNIHLLSAYQIAIGILEEMENQYKLYLKTTLHRGNLLDILSPGELALLIHDVSSKIPPLLSILNEPEDKIEASLNDTHINIFGYLHITDTNLYNVLKITPIPRKLYNNTFVVPDITHSIIATDYNSQTYFELSENDLRHCLKQGKHLFLCVPNAISRIESNPNCIIDEIYERHDKHQCTLRKITIPQMMFKHLLKANTWLFIANPSTHAAVICNGIHNDVTLNGTGIIQISQGCIIKTRRNILASEIMDTIAVKSTFSKPLEFDISQTKPAAQAPVSHLEAETILKTSDSFSTIAHEEKTLQSSLASQHWKTIGNHAATGTITLMIATIIGVVIYRYRCQQRYGVRAPTSITAPPQPAKRTLQPIGIKPSSIEGHRKYDLSQFDTEETPSVTSVTEAENVNT